MMDFNKKNTPPTLELTLCGKCANHYYNSSDYFIERTDESQMIYEPCMICNKPFGYDFSIWDLSTMRKNNSHNGGGGKQ